MIISLALHQPGTVVQPNQKTRSNNARSRAQPFSHLHGSFFITEELIASKYEFLNEERVGPWPHVHNTSHRLKNSTLIPLLKEPLSSIWML